MCRPWPTARSRKLGATAGRLAMCRPWPTARSQRRTSRGRHAMCRPWPSRSVRLMSKVPVAAGRRGLEGVPAFARSGRVVDGAPAGSRKPGPADRPLSYTRMAFDLRPRRPAARLRPDANGRRPSAAAENQEAAARGRARLRWRSSAGKGPQGRAPAPAPKTKWWTERDLNPRPPACKAGILPLYYQPSAGRPVFGF